MNQKKTTTAVRRALLIVTLISLMIWLAGRSSNQASEDPKASLQTRPNIILIVADDMGFSDLGSYGSRHHQTPNLDSSPPGGLRFTQFYNAARCCADARQPA